MNAEADENADVYPSIRSAAMAASKSVFRSLDGVIPDGEKLTAVHVWGNIGADHLAGVIDAIRPFIGAAEVIREAPDASGEPRSSPRAVCLRLNTTVSSGPKPDQHTLEVAVAGPARAYKRYPLVRSAPWLEDLNAYQRDRAGGRPLMVVRSERAGSRQEAYDQARREAARRLLPALEREIARQAPDTRPQLMSRSDAVLQQLEEKLNGLPLVVDRFSQTYARPYGSVYRESLLVTTSEFDLGPIAAAVADELRYQRSSLRRTLLSTGGLVLGIVLMYLFLNAATKGYYAWRLRLLGVVAVAAGIVVVLRLA